MWGLVQNVAKCKKPYQAKEQKEKQVQETCDLLLANEKTKIKSTN